MQTYPINTPTSTTIHSNLSNMEQTRLRDLGSGCPPNMQEEDLLLVEKGFRSENYQEQQWAYLAIEKLAHCTNLLTQSYVESVFPQLLAETTSTSENTSEFAVRAIGALSTHTNSLQPEQIIQAYDKAMHNLQSENFEYRRRGVNLLNDLVHQLDNERQYEAISLLLRLFEEWQQENELEWNEYEKELAARGTAKERFQHQATRAFLWNCKHIQDNAQALTAYNYLTTTLENQELDFRVLPSIASLVDILPSQQRDEAINLIVASVSDVRSWYFVGSGIVQRVNYASDALFILAPVLNEIELQQALSAIELQEWDERESQVFEETIKALEERLEEINGKTDQNHRGAVQ